MRAYSNMPTEDFVAQLRNIAIKAGAMPLVIDQLDAIVLAPSEEEIEEQVREEGGREYERGYREGRAEAEDNKANAVQDAENAMWEACTESLANLHKNDPDNIGLTECQVTQILDWLEKLRP